MEQVNINTDGPIFENKYGSSISQNVKKEKPEVLTQIMTDRIKILDALKEKHKDIKLEFPFNTVPYHKFQPLMKEINEYKKLCGDNIDNPPVLAKNLALLKRAIDLSDHIMKTNASLIDRVGYFVCKWLGLSEVSDAENLYNIEYSKMASNKDQKLRNKVDGLVLLYKRFHYTEEISDENKASLIKSCGGGLCDVQDLVFVEKGKGKYTGRILHGLPEQEGTIVLPNGSIYTGEWNNGKTYGEGTLLIPATRDKNAYIQPVLSENGEFIKGKKIYYSPIAFEEEISRLGLSQKKEPSDISQIIVENSEEDINNDLNTLIEGNKSETEIKKDFERISGVEIEKKLDVDEITVLERNIENNWPAGEIGKDNKLYGYAMKQYKNGDRAIGLFNHGILVDGTMTLKDGTKMSIVKEASTINLMLDASKKFHKGFKRGTFNHFGELSGQWEIQNTDGTKVRGNFYKGNLDGYGEIFDKNGALKEQGIYENGKLSKLVKLDNNKLYIGFFNESQKLYGKGTMIEKNGDSYEGMFVNGNRQGWFTNIENGRTIKSFYDQDMRKRI